MATENSSKKAENHGGALLVYCALLFIASTALLSAPKSLHAYPYYTDGHYHERYLSTSSNSSSTLNPNSPTFWEIEGNRILHRLVGDDSHSFLGFHPRIKVIGANLPLAVLGTEEHLVLSTGILNILESDEEFAFLIAHELAHKLLGHDKETIGATHSRGEWEEEADMLALQLLRGCDMGGSGARTLLQKLANFGIIQGFELGKYYPTLRKRSAFLALREAHLPNL
jgi:hypothetical protein